LRHYSRLPMDDLFGNDSDEDSDIGPAIFGNNTSASSRKVGAVRVGATWNAAVLGNAYGVPVIFGATPTSSQKVGAAGVVHVDGDDRKKSSRQHRMTSYC
jgi:hypothetical protein